ncbi:MAG: hypothetical protein MJ053_02690 [Elusimicrobiaceae bacterium]|nr:hypothetical protein [Elusimicrobiaceae bacterium]
MNRVKKYLFVVLISLFTLPACAQKGKLIKAGADAAAGSLALPVMVKIPVTRGLRIFNAPQSTGFANEVYFYENLRAKRISDMMVFLEVGGKPGWYKVVLSPEGEVVFIPMSSHEISERIYW